MIIVLSFDDNTLREFYVADEFVAETLINFKNQSLFLIWFFVPLSILILTINIYLLYQWIYEKQFHKPNKKKKGEKNVR